MRRIAVEDEEKDNRGTIFDEEQKRTQKYQLSTDEMHGLFVTIGEPIIIR